MSDEFESSKKQVVDSEPTRRAPGLKAPGPREASQQQMLESSYVRVILVHFSTPSSVCEKTKVPHRATRPMESGTAKTFWVKRKLLISGATS